MTIASPSQGNTRFKPRQNLMLQKARASGRQLNWFWKAAFRDFKIHGRFAETRQVTDLRQFNNAGDWGLHRRFPIFAFISPGDTQENLPLFGGDSSLAAYL